jgi:hypothetical protein
MVDTSKGASDGFLQLVVQTRNNAGIAAKSMLVANFGADCDLSGTADGTSAKRFKGLLDKYFGEHDGDGQNVRGSDDPDGAGPEPDPEGKDPKPLPAPKPEPNPPGPVPLPVPRPEPKPPGPAPLPVPPKPGPTDQLAAGQTLADGGHVLAVLADCPAAGAAVIYRAGEFFVLGCSTWTGNKKVPPKTLLYKIPEVKIEKSDNGFLWNFEGNLKSLVVSSSDKAVMTMAEFITKKAATSIARHSPDAFVAGAAPASLKITSSMGLQVSGDLTTGIVSSIADKASISLAWGVSLKKGTTQVAPTGAFLFLSKQVIVSPGAELRL